MHEQEIRRRFPRASKDFLALNAGARLSRAELEPAAQKTLVDRLPRKAPGHPRVTLSYRASFVRPLDPDNLAGATKYCTDALVRCGLLDGDSPTQIEIRWSQEKVSHYDQEKLTLTIEQL
jgi:hypothetical protein